MTIRYTRIKDPNAYAVWATASHRIGTVHKFGMRWLAISPAHRSLGSFPSMAEAASRLIKEEEEK